MPNLYFLCGLPGSGKSYFSKSLIDSYPATQIDWHSSDAIREELYGSESVQEDPSKVFGIMLQRTRESLLAGHTTIYDATNISCKKRRAFLKQISDIECRKVVKVFTTPYKECLKRNANRDRKVPEYVIERMYRNFQIPLEAEGWDAIDLINSESCEPIDSYYTELPHLTHENPHHKLDVKKHMEACSKYLSDRYPLEASIDWLRTAVACHDIGKWFCKTYKNSKGEITEVAHFYNHENTGAYDSLTLSFRLYSEENLLVSQLINWHMRPFEWDKNPDLKKKDAEWLEPKFIRALEIIHDCDINND